MNEGQVSLSADAPFSATFSIGSGSEVFLLLKQDRLTAFVLLMKGYGKQSTSIEEIAKHFDKPIKVASKELDICTTLLKRICRFHGIERWPYRKVLGVWN